MPGLLTLRGRSVQYVCLEDEVADVTLDVLRQVVCSSPGTGVFDVVIARHVLRDDGDYILAGRRQQQSRGQAADAGAATR